MKRNEVVALLLRHAADLREAGVAHVSLFGSTARDAAGPDSDIDLIVEPTADCPITLFNLGPLEDRFAAILGRPVDIVPKTGFDRSTHLRENAQADIVHVF